MLCIVPDVVIHKRTLIRVCQAYAPDSGRYPHHSHMSSTDVSPAVSTCPPSLDAYCQRMCSYDVDCSHGCATLFGVCVFKLH